MILGQVQGSRVSVPRSDDPVPVVLRVERVIDLGGFVFVSGWRDSTVGVSLTSEGSPIPTETIYKQRKDVAERLSLSDGANLGFVSIAAYRPGMSLAIRVDGQTAEPYELLVSILSAESNRSLTLSTRERIELSSKVPLYSQAWKSLMSEVTSSSEIPTKARANFEYARSMGETGGAVISGWLMLAADVRAVWLQSSSHDVFEVDSAIRRERKDVIDVHGLEFPTQRHPPGFALYIQDISPGDNLCVRVLVDQGIVDVAQTTIGKLPDDPVLAAEEIFGRGQPEGHKFRTYVTKVAAPALEPLLSKDREKWSQLPVRQRTYGKAPPSPLVSIIVPLYGRIDFVEHQLLEFAKDEWVLRHAEIIYVIDDPNILDQFITLAPQLYQGYKVSFRYIWGSRNRGYSGANNLGAQEANAQKLLFLNSDAFPQRAGWLEDLIGVLDARPDAGAIGPRLVFADGSIQHAGMSFRYRDDLEIWTNHHPNMGLDPTLDPAGNEVIEVAAVTGACLLVRREHFEDIGGWDDNFLVGDFEDSDLCLKLRDRGLNILYNPLVQLTHLERQSFALLGQSDFRFRVVMYNAIRHQVRWAHLLKEQVDAG